MKIKPPYRMKKLELERWLTDHYFDHYADEVLKKDRYKKTYSKKALGQAVDEHIYHIVHHTNEFWEYIELGHNIDYDYMGYKAVLDQQIKKVMRSDASEIEAELVSLGFYIEDDSLLWRKY